jgi:hypothetical protein
MSFVAKLQTLVRLLAQLDADLNFASVLVEKFRSRAA